MNSRPWLGRFRSAAWSAALALAVAHAAPAFADVAVVPPPTSFVGFFAVVALACGAFLVLVLAVVALILLRHLAKKTPPQEAPAAGDESQSPPA